MTKQEEIRKSIAFLLGAITDKYSTSSSVGNFFLFFFFKITFPVLSATIFNLASKIENLHKILTELLFLIVDEFPRNEWIISEIIRQVL